MAATPSPTGMPPTDTGSDLKKLFDAWGITFDPTKVVGDLTGAWRVRASPDDRVQAVNYVAWFNIRDGINHNDPATADLQPGDSRLGRCNRPRHQTRRSSSPRCSPAARAPA